MSVRRQTRAERRPAPALLLVLGFMAAFALGQAAEASPSPRLEVFVREGCPHCTEAKHFIADLHARRPDILIQVHDVGADPEALVRLGQLAAQFHVEPIGVPAFWAGGELIVGYGGAGSTGLRLIELLDQGTAKVPSATSTEACRPALACDEPARSLSSTIDRGIDLPWIGPVSVQQVGLPVFTLLIGLLDGFNPCAMWILLFLLSLLVNLHDRTKMTLIAGTFVLVSGLVYFAFMGAWLNAFLFVGLSRPVQLALGIVAVMIGTVNMKDFVSFKSGISFSIPPSAKPGLYARMRRILEAEHLPATLMGVATLAVLVNLVELLCTAGLPALYTHVLTLQNLSLWEYYGYLALYNIAYIADDTLMVAIAIITLTRRKLQDRGVRWLKLVSGTVMVGLGFLLLVRPDLLH